MTTAAKIVSRPELLARARSWRAAADTIRGGRAVGTVGQVGAEGCEIPAWANEPVARLRPRQTTRRGPDRAGAPGVPGPVERQAGRTAQLGGAPRPSIVLANGCFDILHAGHIRYLQAAAASGDHLVVAINADEAVCRLKGPGQPILDQQARALLVAAVRGVAAVTVFDEPTVEPLLRALRPDIHAKGTDYTADSVPEAAVARELGIKVLIVGDPKHHSTRDLLTRLRKLPG